ncbi:hypothetical protein K438DRAFT_1979482 [Mycena galopus ATCC 62051]|nr:hypothetical protein K438DRAFT_1979482 [Mycena galopus ATCC 62051]
MAGVAIRSLNTSCGHKRKQLPSTTDAATLHQISKDLASAFSKVPLARALLGEWSSPTSERAVELFMLHLQSGLSDGEIFAVGADDSIEGVAVVYGPGKDMKAESPEWAAFIGDLPPENQEWYKSFGIQANQFTDRAYGQNHQLDSYYLSLIGVRPSSQGKGLGAELFRGVQAKASCIQSATLQIES